MANEGTIRIHRSIAGTTAAFRVSFVPYDAEEESGGERSFRELQQVRAFLKMLGLGAEYIKDALRQLTGPLSFGAERFALGQGCQERSFRESRKSGKEQRVMAYSEKVVDHYNNPRNVGSLPKEDPNVGTGLVGAPECGDVMKLQMKINPETQVIEEAKFKTFGCGSAIASSSLATEWVKGKTVEEALSIKNTDIVRELSLPPVKIHCSVLAEDAIKAAIGDWKKKHGVEVPVNEKASH